MKRETSLYYATLGTREAALLLRAWAASAFESAAARRAALAREVDRHVAAAGVYAYASARGALAACLQSAGVGAGDEVVLSAFTCLAVPTAVVAAGARPVYVDIDRRSLNTPASAVIAAMGPSVRAVIVQHTLGKAAEVEAIAAAARSRGILVIEDCALAFGARLNGRMLGSFGDAAIWSLELSKTITTGWGGVLCVRDPALNARVASHYENLPEPSFGRTTRLAWQAALTGVCYEPQRHRLGKYAVAAAFRLGVFRPSTDAAETAGCPSSHFVAKLGGAQAALAAYQWSRLDAIASRVEANGRRLRAALAEVGLLAVGVPAAGDFAVTPRVPFVVSDRSPAQAWFQAAGVELGTWFDGPLSPPPRDPVVFNYDPAQYPQARFLARHVVNLPSHSRLAEEDLDHIVATLRAYASRDRAERRFTEQFLDGFPTHA